MNKYSFDKYKDLWAKYSSGAKCPDRLPVPKVASQEESIKWSLSFKEYLQATAKTSGISISDLEQAFIEAAANKNPNYTNVEWGIGHIKMLIRANKAQDITGNSSVTNDGLVEVSIDINDDDLIQAKADVDKFGLFFDINSSEDLFFEHNQEIFSVIDFE